MKQDKVVFLIFLALLTGASAHAKDPAVEINNNENLRRIAEYFVSLDQASRTHLASKLYYLDPSTEKQEAQGMLFEELKKGGRVLNDKGLSPSPRTDW